MAATRQSKQQANGRLKEASDQVTHAIEASVTERPGRQEMVFDVALLAAGALEVISPPAALVGVLVNRLVHVTR